MSIRDSRSVFDGLFKALAILILMSICSPLVAQTDNAELKQFTLQVNGADSKPLANVALWLTQDYPRFPVVDPGTPQHSARATSGADGRATVRMPAAPVNIVATAPGMAPLFIRGFDLTRQPMSQINLSAGRSLSGVVQDENKVALGGAHVTARRKDFPLDYMNDFIHTTTTDADGKFSLDHLADGAYVINVQPDAGGPPAAFEPTVVQLAAGAEPLPMTLTALPGVVFKGKFVSRDQSVEGRRITVLVRLPAETRFEVKSDASGDFTIAGIPAGASGFLAFDSIRELSTVISIDGVHPGVSVQQTSIRFSSVPSGTIDGIEVKFLHQATARGRVVDPLGVPVPNAPLVVDQTSRIYQANEAGEYTAPIPPGMDVTIRGYGQGRIIPMPMQQPVRAEEGQTIEKDVIVQLKPELPHDGEISGKIIDANGKPVKGAKIFLANTTILPQLLMHPATNFAAGPGARPTRPTFSWTGGEVGPASTTSKDDGAFLFDKLDPGTSDVWAYDPHAGWAWVSDVVTNSTRNLELRLAPTDPQTVTISGSITDVDGKPAGGVTMFLVGGDVRTNILSKAVTDQNGAYSISTKVFDVQADTWRNLSLVGHDATRGFVWRTLPLCSLKDVRMQFRPTSVIGGRVVNTAGAPVQGAAVSPYSMADPQWGSLVMWRYTIDIAPPVMTNADGAFELSGVPQGVTAALQATHPDYNQAETFSNAKITPRFLLDDIKMPDGISVEGTVRQADTHQPVQNATVMFGRDLDGATLTTDANGHYRFSVERTQIMLDTYVEVRASAGEGVSLLDGNTRYRGQLQAGDHVKDVNIEIKPSLAVREAEWRSQSGKPASTAALLAVYEDFDSLGYEKTAQQDTFSIYKISDISSPAARIGGLNVRFGVGRTHGMARGLDGSIWAADPEIPAKLIKYSRDGKPIWVQSEISPSSIAVDPKTGNAWVLVNRTDRNARGNLVIVDPDGKKISEPAIPNGSDIVYSQHDDCFWLTGQQLLKVDRNGKLLAQSAERFGGGSYCLDVYDKDGSVWVTQREHPQQRGTKDALMIYEPTGKLRKEIPGIDLAVAVDSARDAVWAVSRFQDDPHVQKLNIAGDVQATIPVAAMSLTIEPETGYVWIATLNSIDRVDADGHLVTSIKTDALQKTIALIP